jgi:hypothetical protein
MLRFVDEYFATSNFKIFQDVARTVVQQETRFVVLCYPYIPLTWQWFQNNVTLSTHLHLLLSELSIYIIVSDY